MDGADIAVKRSVLLDSVLVSALITASSLRCVSWTQADACWYYMLVCTVPAHMSGAIIITIVTALVICILQHTNNNNPQLQQEECRY